MFAEVSLRYKVPHNVTPMLSDKRMKSTQPPHQPWGANGRCSQGRGLVETLLGPHLGPTWQEQEDDLDLVFSSTSPLATQDEETSCLTAETAAPP